MIDVGNANAGVTQRNHTQHADRQAMAIHELVQLNQSHAFSNDREALIRMLDQAIGRIN